QAASAVTGPGSSDAARAAQEAEPRDPEVGRGDEGREAAEGCDEPACGCAKERAGRFKEIQGRRAGAAGESEGYAERPAARAESRAGWSEGHRLNRRREQFD